MTRPMCAPCGHQMRMVGTELAEGIVMRLVERPQHMRNGSTVAACVRRIYRPVQPKKATHYECLDCGAKLPLWWEISLLVQERWQRSRPSARIREVGVQ